MPTIKARVYLSKQKFIIFTSGSGDEDDNGEFEDHSMDYDEADLFEDIETPLDLVVAREAAQSETSTSRSSDYISTASNSDRSISSASNV